MNVAHPRTIRFWESVSSVCLLLFVVIAWSVASKNALTLFDTEVAVHLDDYARNHAWLVSIFLVITKIGSWPPLYVVAVAGAICFGLRKQYLLAVLWLIALILGGFANDLLKEIVHRDRPPNAHATGWSFPSGHSIRATITYGFLAYWLIKLVRPCWLGRAIVVLAALLALTVGFSRMFLGNHYFSDVLGAFSFGTAWCAGWIAYFEHAYFTKPHAEHSNSPSG